MASIKWGVLGTANIARGCTIPGMKLAKDCELYAIAGRSLEKAEGFKEEFGFRKAYGSYEELIADKDVQAVYIPLPNSLHLKWVKEALNAGKHVICEKPLALNADEAKEMFDTAKENGVYLMEAYAYLHNPYVESLKKDIADGGIGDVDYIETAFVTQGYKEDIRLHKDLGGGAMYDLGCYCTTMILSLVDSEPEYVKACAEFTDLGVDSMTSGIIRFENGVRASFNVGMVLGENTDSRYDRLYIHGSKGAIRSEVEYNQQGEAGYRIFIQDGVIERKISIPQNYSLEIAQMCSCINGNKTPHVTPEFSIKNARLMDKVFKEIGYWKIFKETKSKYKARFGCKAKMIPAADVEPLIGHDVGGVCPFGINEGVTVYLDESLKQHDTVYPAAGSSKSAVRLSIRELEECSGFREWVDVCK